MPTYDEYKQAIEAEPKNYTVDKFSIFDTDDGLAETARVDYSFIFEGKKLNAWFELRLDEDSADTEHLRNIMNQMAFYSNKEAAQDKKEGVGVYARTT